MQILVHLPNDLAAKFKAAVPQGKRSSFIAGLLEKALPSDEEDPLYLLALEVEQDERLNAEMGEWNDVIGDGLEHD